MVTVEPDGSVPMSQSERTVCIQSALLYTTSAGERRIRVQVTHLCCLNPLSVPRLTHACLSQDWVAVLGLAVFVLMFSFTIGSRRVACVSQLST